MNDKMTSEEKQKIIDTLSSKGANQPCPRCGRDKFILMDGYFNQSLQNSVSANLTLGGPSVPSVAIICNNCGFISQHAIGILGLLPNEEGENE